MAAAAASSVPGVRELMRLSSAGAQREITVAEHSAPEFNGRYTRVGTWNSRPAFRQVGEGDAPIEYFLYYWAAMGADGADDVEGVGKAAADAEPEPAPEGRVEEEQDDSEGLGDFGAGWTFDARPRLAVDPGALSRTVSLAQPPALGRGCGGVTEQPYLTKTYPPCGRISLMTFGTVVISGEGAATVPSVGEAPLERIASEPAAVAAAAAAVEPRAEEAVPPARQSREAWLSRVMTVQSSRMTPEVRGRVQRRAEAQKRAHRSRKKAGRLQACSAMTQRSWAKGMRSMATPCVPRVAHTDRPGRGAASSPFTGGHVLLFDLLNS
jgi:hypothetical protein